MLGDELGTEFCWPKEKKSKYRIAFYSIYCKSGRIMNCQLRHIPYSGRKSKHFLRISEITFRRKYLLRPFLSLTRSAPFLYLPDAVFTFLS